MREAYDYIYFRNQTHSTFQKLHRIDQRDYPEEAVLFGSRAKGTATDRSDFDAFQEEIEEIPTLYSFDIVDMDTCNNQLLIEEIRQYGRKIS